MKGRENARGLSVLPVLVGILLAFEFELFRIDGAGGDGVDSTTNQNHRSAANPLCPPKPDPWEN